MGLLKNDNIPKHISTIRFECGPKGDIVHEHKRVSYGKKCMLTFPVSILVVFGLC